MSNVTAVGKLIGVEVPGAPSPANPGEPVPTIVVTIPLLAVQDLTRLLPVSLKTAFPALSTATLYGE